jgi:hypothetical protein
MSALSNIYAFDEIAMKTTFVAILNEGHLSRIEGGD